MLAIDAFLKEGLLSPSLSIFLESAQIARLCYQHGDSGRLSLWTSEIKHEISHLLCKIIIILLDIWTTIMWVTL